MKLTNLRGGLLTKWIHNCTKFLGADGSIPVFVKQCKSLETVQFPETVKNIEVKKEDFISGQHGLHLSELSSLLLGQMICHYLVWKNKIRLAPANDGSCLRKLTNQNPRQE